MSSADRTGLDRFVAAQGGGVYERALAELRAGRKTSHWMWFVFPQLAGLGYSAMAQRYAIGSLAQARAYLAHPLLGSRLVECARALLSVTGRSAEQILGGVDAIKLRSSMTLFDRARDSLATDGEPAPGGEPAPTAPHDRSVFAAVLAHLYDGEPDPATLEQL